MQSIHSMNLKKRIIYNESLKSHMSMKLKFISSFVMVYVIYKKQISHESFKDHFPDFT